LHRSLQFIVQDGASGTSTGLTSPAGSTAANKGQVTPSPIARLARIEALSGKTSAMHTLVCVRPSELFFVLQSMELSNISAAPLSAYSKELSQAITHMHTSDLLQRLHSELRLTPVPSNGSTASAGSTSAAETSGTGILDALKEAGVPFLDRELTFLLQISPHAVYNSEFLHHFNDDSIAPSLPVKGLSGPGHGTDSFHSTHSEAADFSALLTCETVEESDEAHALASIRWLVQAARSALKSMYEHNSASVVKNHSTVREMQELRHKLLARRDEIASILADWKKIATCMELCTNYKAQISLLLEKYRYHKKVAQQASVSPLFWNSSNGVTASAPGNDPAPSTVALLEATANMTAAGAAKDAEVQAALSKIVLLQLRLEGELMQSTAAPRPEAGSVVDLGERGGATPVSGARSASKLAALAALSPLRSSTPQSTMQDSPMGLLRARAPNPLHVVMQSVFTSTAGASHRK
jgi:hypothetical protein